jgi:hypothetical protein
MYLPPGFKTRRHASNEWLPTTSKSTSYRCPFLVKSSFVVVGDRLFDVSDLENVGGPVSAVNGGFHRGRVPAHRRGNYLSWSAGGTVDKAGKARGQGRRDVGALRRLEQPVDQSGELSAKRAAAGTSSGGRPDAASIRPVKLKNEASAVAS